MTTTEPIDILSLSPASDETIRVLDWVATRLRDAFNDRAPEHDIRRLLTQVSLWTTDANETVAAITQRKPLPPLDWYRQTRSRWNGRRHYWTRELVGYSGLGYHADPVDVAARWATELRLTELDELDKLVSPGTREWAGEIEGWTVSVWAVSDHEAFEAK